MMDPDRTKGEVMGSWLFIVDTRDPLGCVEEGRLLLHPDDFVGNPIQDRVVLSSGDANVKQRKYQREKAL